MPVSFPKHSFNARQRLNKAVNTVALYRATAAALGSINALEPAANIEDAVRATKEQMALEVGMLSWESLFHKTVDTMKREEKADLVFSFLDTNNRNHIGIAELEAGLETLRAASKNDYPPAASLVEIFTSRRKGDLSRDDFESVIDGLAASSIDCTFEDMCQLLLHCMLFTKSASSIVEETVISIAGQSRYKVDEAIAEARMVLLFNAMDETHCGYVNLEDLSKALFRVTEKIESIQERELLLMLQYRNLRKLDFELFSEHIMDVAESFPGTNVNDLANEITLELCTRDISDEEIKQFVDADQFNDSVSTFGSVDSPDKLHASSSSFGILAPIASLWHYCCVDPVESDENGIKDCGEDPNTDEVKFAVALPLC